MVHWNEEGVPIRFLDWLYHYDTRIWWEYYRRIWEAMWGRLR